ncbi:MAG: zinc ribbon domain-containing protein [Vicinamibacterales bacterium]
MTDRNQHVKTRMDSAEQNRLAERVPAVTSALECRACGHENPDSARFCEACGSSTSAACPRCHKPPLPGADICESCGLWLLVGQCPFCTQPVGVDQTYCGHCGNEAAGISCSACGQRSPFDFCPNCAKPLSRQAQELINAASSDPSQHALASLVEELHTVHAIPSSHEFLPPAVLPRQASADEVRQMKAARQAAARVTQAPTHRPPADSLFTDDQRQGIGRLADQVTAEQARLKLEEERRRQEVRRQQEEAERKRREQEEERQSLVDKINQALSASRGKTFASHQEARRYFMSVVAGLPDELVRSLTSGGIRWRCNAYGNEHSSPAGCAAPAQGGVWLLH